MSGAGPSKNSVAPGRGGARRAARRPGPPSLRFGAIKRSRYRSDTGRGGLAVGLAQESVDGVEIGARTGFDHVGAGAFAGDQTAAAEIHLDGHFAQGVLALGDGAQGIIQQPAAGLGQAVDGLQGGVNGAVADAGVLDGWRLFLPASFCRRTVAVGTARLPLVTLKIIERPGFRHFGDLALDQRGQIVVIDKFLLVANFLEAGENGGDVRRRSF